MNLTTVMHDLFPTCTLWGSMAEMDAYATPQNCTILAQGGVHRGTPEGRKHEAFLIEYQGVMMHLDVTDRWPVGGVNKAHAAITRMEGPGLSREVLEAWSRGMIEHASLDAAERQNVAALARRGGPRSL